MSVITPIAGLLFIIVCLKRFLELTIGHRQGQPPPPCPAPPCERHVWRMTGSPLSLFCSRSSLLFPFIIYLLSLFLSQFRTFFLPPHLSLRILHPTFSVFTFHVSSAESDSWSAEHDDKSVCNLISYLLTVQFTFLFISLAKTVRTPVCLPP